MKSPLEIKVCGNIKGENLREVCKLRPDYVGFIFYEHSRRHVSNQPEPGLLQNCSAKRVGVFVNATQSEIEEKVNSFQLDYIQLHGDESPEFCQELSQIRPIFKAFQINNNFNFNILIHYISSTYMFLFDASSKSYGGSGKQFDWELLSNYTLEKPFFLSGGIEPEDAKKIRNLSHPQLVGIDVNSGFETEPGIKNINQLTTFFNQIRR